MSSTDGGLLGSATQLSRQSVEASLPALSVLVSKLFVAKAFMNQNEVCRVSPRVKLESHLGFVSVGSGRFPRPGEAQAPGSINLAVLTGNDDGLITSRGHHAHPIVSSDLEIHFGAGWPEIVARSVPVSHPDGVSPGRENLVGRGVDVFLEANGRFRRAGHGGDFGLHQPGFLVPAFPLVLDRVKDDGIEPGIAGRLPRRWQSVSLGEFAREHFVEDDTRWNRCPLGDRRTRAW